MINNVTLVGRLTKDPELRYTQSGVPTATFTLAVNRTFKQENGPDADFINIVVWRKPAENAANYLKKGSLAGIVGRIQTRNYEGQDGKRVFVVEVVAESVQFMDPKPRNEEQQQPARRNEPPKVEDPFANGGQTIDISDDDLPF